MAQLIRNILAVLAAVLVGGLLIMLVQSLNGRLYPPPEGLDFHNAEQVKQYAATLPTGAFLMVLLSYLIGFTAAVTLAVRLSGDQHARQGILVVLFFGAASVMNLLGLPHPVWFAFANAAVLGFAGWAGFKLGWPKAAKAD